MRQTSAWSLSSGWLSKQLSCEAKQTDLLLVAQEDFGGEAIHGPAALWQFKELHDLGAFNEAQRAAGFLCQLSKADQTTPTGFRIDSADFPGIAAFRLATTGSHR